ncbi:MAG: hypothetical protein ACRD0U_13585 [Acidimicrobiales bacterium]
MTAESAMGVVCASPPITFAIIGYSGGTQMVSPGWIRSGFGTVCGLADTSRW